jgi:hypothetical protein
VSTATIRIEKCIQDIQNVSSNPNESRMCSQIYFEMEVDEKVHKELTVEISQPYGSDYANEPVEVGRPEGYEGPFNHEQFSEAVENYYRSLVGSGGSGISFSGGGNICMKKNTFMKPAEFQIEINHGKEGAW